MQHLTYWIYIFIDNLKKKNARKSLFLRFRSSFNPNNKSDRVKSFDESMDWEQRNGPLTLNILKRYFEILLAKVKHGG